MHIHYITNTHTGLKIGERNQALGVVDALRASVKGVIILEHDISEMDRLNSVLHEYKGKHVVIGVSDSGIHAFSQLDKEKRHNFVLMGHEVPKNTDSVTDKLNILAIPKYVVDCPLSIKGVKIIRMDGVAHTMTPEKAEVASVDWAEKLPLNDRPVVVAMLGGEVDGIQYKADEAAKMAEYIAQKAKEIDAYVLASNSPRSNPSDTEVFSNVLSYCGCDGAFFPFHMKNQNNETPYRAMVGLVAKHPKSRIIITGDSVSMPCEIASVLPPERIWLYSVSNLNKQNQEFAEWMFKSGRAGRVAIEEGGFKEQFQAGNTVSKMDAGKQIATAILALMGR